MRVYFFEVLSLFCNCMGVIGNFNMIMCIFMSELFFLDVFLKDIWKLID